MQAWQFAMMQTIAAGKKVPGEALLELKQDGLIFLEQSTETWMPTPEANDEFKRMAWELQNGRVAQ